jgi:hypothetical protein
MTKPVLFAALSLSLLALPNVAHAQLRPDGQTGTLMPGRPQAMSPEHSAETRKEFASCVYHLSKQKVLALLAGSDFDTVVYPPEVRDWKVDLNLEECLGKQAMGDQYTLGMKISDPVLRDLLAEEAYLAKYSKAPTTTQELVPIEVRLAATNQNSTSTRAMAEFADCTIRHDVVGADALLRTKPASQQERKAAGTLAPAMGQCLDKTQKFSLTPASVRAFVAFAMWSRFGQ